MIGGDGDALDIGDMALSALARATSELCQNPQDQAAINAFVAARRGYREVRDPLGA